jgi:hypothetical protein
MKNDQPSIFISHIADEQEVALAIQDMVESIFLQADVYVSSSPVSNPAGAAWYDKMITQLREASAIIIICSERSIDRPWVNFETGAGITRDIPVIPLILSGLDVSSIRIPFSLLQAKAATNEQHLKDLINSLADVLGARPPKSPEAHIADAISKISEFEKGYCVSPEIIQTYAASRDAQLEIGKRLSMCQDRLLLCGVQFAVSLSDWRDDYVAALTRGVNIDIVMLDPNGTAVAITANSYGMKESELKTECEDSLAKALELRREAQKASMGVVNIYLMNTLPRARYYIFDPEERSGVLTFTAYLEDTRSSYSPTVAYRGDSSIARKYYEVCKKLIQNSTLVP